MKVYTDREILRILRVENFLLVRTKGDHSIYRHSDGRVFNFSRNMNRMVFQRLVKECKLNVSF